jgi:hypothetical protein
MMSDRVVAREPLFYEFASSGQVELDEKRHPDNFLWLRIGWHK